MEIDTIKTVVELTPELCTDFMPYSRQRGKFLQNPQITLVETDSTFTVTGKKVMWSLLDALFPDDPLPRILLTEDIFTPTEHTPSARDILCGLIEDSQEKFLILTHDIQNNVLMVEPFSRLALTTDIDSMRNTLERLKISIESTKPYSYRTRSRNTLRPAIRGRYRGTDKMILIVDIGIKYYLVPYVMDKGEEVALSEPMVISKDDSYLPFFEGVFSLSMPKVITHRPYNKKNLLTREYHLITNSFILG